MNKKKENLNIQPFDHSILSKNTAFQEPARCWTDTFSKKMVPAEEVNVGL